MFSCWPHFIFPKEKQMAVIEIICDFKVAPNLWILIQLFIIIQQKLISFFPSFFLLVFYFDLYIYF